MMRARPFSFILCAQLGIAALAQQPFPSSLREQQAQSGLPANKIKAAFSAITDSRALSNGIEIHSGQAVMQVTALRDDVLRIRAGAAGILPEDASWAVAASTRETRMSVAPRDDAKTVGFRTKLLEVSIDRATARLVISDMHGKIINSDALGHNTSFENGSFHVWKTLPSNEHFFGLGDKTGPLDRREQAFIHVEHRRLRLPGIDRPDLQDDSLLPLRSNKAYATASFSTIPGVRTSTSAAPSGSPIPLAPKAARSTTTSSTAPSPSKSLKTTPGLPARRPCRRSGRLVINRAATPTRQNRNCVRLRTVCGKTRFPPMPSGSISISRTATAHSPSTLRHFPTCPSCSPT